MMHCASGIRIRDLDDWRPDIGRGILDNSISWYLEAMIKALFRDALLQDFMRRQIWCLAETD